MSLILSGLAWLVGLSAGLLAGAPGGLVWPGGAALLGAAVAPGGSRARPVYLWLGLLLLGAWRAGQVSPGLVGGPLSPFRDERVSLHGVIAGPPRCGPTSCTFILQAQLLEVGGRTERVEAPVQARTRVDPELAYGRQATLHGELKTPRSVVGFPSAEILARQGIHETMEYPRLWLGPPVSASEVGRLEVLRSDLEHRLTSGIPGVEGQLVAGLLLGRDVALAPEVRDQLRRTGTSHILAVSGFNVTLIGGLAVALLVIFVQRGWALFAAGGLVLFYTLLVGAPPSAVRAGLMFLLAGLAGIVGRLPDPITSLVLVAACMAGIDPSLLLDLGFQLSFAATAGLVLAGGRLTPTWQRLPRWLANGFGITLAATVFTLPLVVHVFHSVALVAPLANVLIGPALPAAMALGGLSLVATGLPFVEQIIGGAAWLVAHYILLLIAWSASLPFAAYATGSLPAWGVLAAYGFLLLPFVWPGFRSSAASTETSRADHLPAVLSCAGLVLVALLASGRTVPAGTLRAVFFDVGGGDLTLVETPSGRRLLLGAVDTSLAANALAEQLPLFDRGIDLLVVTRGAERDLAGLATIVQRYPVGQVIQPALAGEVWQRWRELLAEKGVRDIVASPGLLVDLGAGSWLEISGVSIDDAGRPVSLGARLQSGNLDLRVVGGHLPSAPVLGQVAVVRLAPGLAVDSELRALAPPARDRLAIVGGRPRGQADPPLVSFQLGGSEIVDLSADGTSVSLRRRGCREQADLCSWSRSTVNVEP